MNVDRYTRCVLTVIALALAADAARGFLAIPEARAATAEPMRCEIVGTVKVEGKLGLDTSSYSPIVVKSDDFQVKLHDSPVTVKVERIEGRVTTHSE